MNEFSLLALGTALLASIVMAALLGFIRPKPSLPAGVVPVKRTLILSNLERDLAEAGIAMTAQRYIAYSVSMGLFIALAIEVLFKLEILAVFIGLGLSTVGLRVFYLSPHAAKRRKQQMNHVILSCREIASLIHADNPASIALELYATQATSKGVESLTRKPNQVAEAIAQAILMSKTKGLNLGMALRESAERLGSVHYRGMVEAYIRSENLNKEQVAKALLFHAEGVGHKLMLRRSMAQVMGLPVAEYKGMGMLSPALGIYMIVNLPDTVGVFWFSAIGQIIAVGLFAYWYLGFWLQKRPLNERD